MKYQVLIATILATGLSHAAEIIPVQTEFRVRLLTPISTETSKKGFKIAAQVLTPPEFNGSVMEGEVRESKSGGKIKSTSVLNFSLDILNYKDRQVKVQSSVKSITNSKGQENVDDEGRIVKKKNSLGKVALGTGAGAIIGALAGGATGAAIGAGIGAGASLILVQTAVEGANVSFASGTEFVMDVKER